MRPTNASPPRRALALVAALALAGGAALVLAAPAGAATGVAFVHGKGGPELANATVAWNYWTTDMIRTATKGYTIPYVVCHYDGTRVMWEAGDVVVDQIHAFITSRGINDLVIDTHSFGGVVTRWIVSNPDRNPKYRAVVNAIRWVNTIAAPHGGSEAADLAGTLSGSWLTGWLVDLVGQNNASTRNCRTADMAYYNRYWLNGTAGRPPLAKTFYWVSGWGLWNDYWGKFHSEDFGLATLSGIVGLPGEDDGMVAEWSAQLVGRPWFRTEANHHHNRRNDYKPIGASLATDF
jgi:hypothetical protein